MINSATSNSFTYSGEVTFTLSINGHKGKTRILNSGTKHLLDSITKALAGYSIQDAVPKYIDLIQGSATLEECTSCLIQPLMLTGQVYGEAAEAGGSEGVVLLNSIIMFEDKKSITTLDNPRLVLKDSNSRILSYISGNDALQELWDGIVDGSEALIEWRMIFRNKERS